jgi:hypothetical protein
MSFKNNGELKLNYNEYVETFHEYINQGGPDECPDKEVYMSIYNSKLKQHRNYIFGNDLYTTINNYLTIVSKIIPASLYINDFQSEYSLFEMMNILKNTK